MKPACSSKNPWFVLPLVMVLLVLNSRVSAAEPTQEMIQKINAAIPEKPTVEPRGSRRVLIFSHCEGFKHGAIPIGKYALKMLGEKTGAFEATVSDDVSIFEGSTLDDFDAIIFNNSTGELFEDKQSKRNLLEFVRNGKGIVGVHAATDCFYEWPQFGEMMGGYFDGHPWHEEVTLRLDDPGHPLTAMFGGKPFVVTDEIYQFRSPYSRQRLRVLLSLEPTANDVFKKGTKRPDHDYAVSWIRDYGQGRVFYCSLGHRDEIFWNPVVLRHFLAGIQYAIGDLPADATPSASADTSLDMKMGLGQALAAAMKYEYGDSRMPLSVIAANVHVALDDSSKRQVIIKQLHGLLVSGEATDACKSFVCRQLSLIGGEESVAPLAALLADPELSHMARYALERIPGPEVDSVLRKAMLELDGELRIGVINSIGRRGDQKAMGDLRQVAEAGDRDTLLAAVEAAGKVGGMNAEGLIFRVYAKAEEEGDAELMAAVMEPLLRIAEGHLAHGKFDKARAMYSRIYEGDHPKAARIAGLRGLAMADPVASVGMVLDMLGDEDPEWSGVAASLVVELPGEQVTREFVRLMEAFPAVTKVRLIEALAERGDGAAAPALADLIGQSGKQVEAAAITALGSLGNASHVKLLTPIAARDGDPARASLDRLPGDDVDAAMAAAMEEAPPPQRLELARSLGTRGAVEQLPKLLEHAEFDRDRLVRGQALRSIGELAGIEHIDQIVCVLVNANTDDDRRAAGDCIVMMFQRHGDQDALARPLVAALDESDRSSVRRGLLRTLGKVGGDLAYSAVLKAAEDGGPSVDAALDTLAEWPDAEAADDLLDLSQHSRDAELRRASFHGFVHTAGLKSDRSAAVTARMFETALATAEDDDEIRLALGGLARVADSRALELALFFLDQPAVAREAASAVVGSARAIGDRHSDLAAGSVKRVITDFAGDEELLEKAREAMAHIERNRDFIKDWKYSGPYSREKHGLSQIFDAVFPPESVTAEVVEWSRLSDAAYVAPGIFDFLKIGGGSDCCGYVMTEIVSGADVKARLEIGSDDGVKAWLNGKVVHANNAARGLTIGQDVVEIQLRKGVNTLMLKITQGGGDWRFCCRLRDRAGNHLEGVRIRRPE